MYHEGPLYFRRGERLRIVLVNDTVMPHPIHLHGMWSVLESPTGAIRVREHTIMIQPAQRITYLVNADAHGNRAYHCHLLFHMEAGMLRTVVMPGMPADLSEIEAGPRLRYEFSRTVAPCVGVVWNRKFGNTARCARQADGPVQKIEAVAGIRIWF